MSRLLALLVAASLSIGCATTETGARREWLAASAADSVSTYLALRDGAREANPLYAPLDNDPAGVALASFAASLAVGWMIEKAIARRPRKMRPKIRQAVLSIRWLPVPINLNSQLDGR